MSGLASCIYTAQGEIVCLPNKNEESKQESQLIETFAVARTVAKKPEQKKSSSLKCSNTKPCPKGETCSKFGWCRSDLKS